MIISKQWAPECAFPGCTHKVGFHKKISTGGPNGPKWKWKMFCSAHRGIKKHEVDTWKLGQGCANIDMHHGFPCTSHISSASQLDVNHIDGDRNNQDPSNLEILCKVCHQQVTMNSGHHLTRYNNQVELDPELFEF